MSWAVGWSSRWQRDVGYGVPSLCDWPDCGAEIDRGLAYVCGDMHDDVENGCALYFCGEHLGTTYVYDDVVNDDGDVIDEVEVRRCSHGDQLSKKPDTDEWVQWKLRDDSWVKWRAGHGWAA